MAATKLSVITRAAQQAARAAEKRNEMIRQAHADGYSMRAIAGAAGLSFQRIHQIVNGR